MCTNKFRTKQSKPNKIILQKIWNFVSYKLIFPKKTEFSRDADIVVNLKVAEFPKLALRHGVLLYLPI